jgi:hypothetical protein
MRNRKCSLLGRKASFLRNLTFSGFLTDHMCAQVRLIPAKVWMVKGTGICSPSCLAKAPVKNQETDGEVDEPQKAKFKKASRTKTNGDAQKNQLTIGSISL